MADQHHQLPPPQELLPPEWPFLAYDKCVSAGPGLVQVFSDGRMSLAEYLIKHRMVVVLHGGAYDPEGDHSLPGEKDGAYYYRLASDDAKGVISSLVQKVLDAEALGVCLSPIGLDNLRLSDKGGVKFKGVEVLQGLGQNELDDGLRGNFDQCASIAFYLFGGDPPEDIQHLIDLMRNNYNARSMYPVHASLVPMGSFAALLRELHDYSMFKIPKYVLRLILQALPHIPNWRNVVRSSHLLEVTLNHRDGDNYKVPYNKHQGELYREQHEALLELGICGHLEHHQIILSTEQLAMINALKQYDYLRNRNAHRMEALLNFYWLELGMDYTALNSEMAVMVRFPLTLCEVQRVLQEHELLNQLNLRSLFNCPD